MKSNDVKRWFLKHFGIKVKVRTVAVKTPFIQVWIAGRSEGNNYVYDQAFPDSLGNKCMRIVYKGCAALEAQNWGGNFTPHSLSFNQREWEALTAHPDFAS